MKTNKSKSVVKLILSFAVLVFAFGIYSFFNLHWKNQKIRNTLDAKGTETTGYVVKLSKLTERELSQNSKDWQYLDDYVLEYWYKEQGMQEKSEFALENYLEGEKKESEVRNRDLDKITMTTSISKQLYKELEFKNTIRIKYLEGEINSARILNSEGEIDIPKLQLFGYLCIILTIASLLSLIQFVRNERRT